ncbi:MAG: SUMF1/EgtB/PvdO family nonheme iron enzyme [Planctomycetota bacterium]
MTRRRGIGAAFGLVALIAVALAVWAALAEPAPPALVPVSTLGMVEISNADFEESLLAFGLEEFWIDRFEVTEGAWQDYADEAGVADPLDLLVGLPRSSSFPMRLVRFDEAQGFAKWYSKALPTNAQWELAILGPSGSAMPWGSGFDYAANTIEAWENRAFVGHGVTHVGTFAKGRSAVGCYDMVGNVWEWTDSTFHDAFRNPRFQTDADYDRDHGELRASLQLLNDWPPFYELPARRSYLSSSDDLLAISESGTGILELLFALVPQEEFRLEQFGTTVSDAQYVLEIFDTKLVSAKVLYADPLSYEAIDPRLLFVIDDADAQDLKFFDADLSLLSHYKLDTHTFLDAADELLLGPDPWRVGDGAAIDISQGMGLLSVLEFEQAEGLRLERERIENRLNLIRSWQERYSGLLSARANLENGEREYLKRGGSFRTAIRGANEPLERLENAETASWDLGFRCVVTKSELRRQRRILPLIADLGWQDPVHWLTRVRPARRALVAAGQSALPYLERAFERSEPLWLKDRLVELINEIRKQS